MNEEDATSNEYFATSQVAPKKAPEQIYFCSLAAHSAKKAKFCCSQCGAMICNKCIVTGSHVSHGVPVKAKNAMLEMLHHALRFIEELLPQQSLLLLYQRRCKANLQQREETRRSIMACFDSIIYFEMRDKFLAEIDDEVQLIQQDIELISAAQTLLAPKGVELLEVNPSWAEAFQLFTKLKHTAQRCREGHFATVLCLMLQPSVDSKAIVTGKPAAACVRKKVRRFGSRGNAPGQFGFIAGLCWNAAGSLLVADRINRRVQEISTDGRAGRVFPSATGILNVAIDSANQIYVCQDRNKALQVLDKDGKAAGTIPYQAQPGRVIASSHTTAKYALLQTHQLVQLGTSFALQLPPSVEYMGSVAIDNTRQRAIFCDNDRSEVHIYDLATSQQLPVLGKEKQEFRGQLGAVVEERSGDIIIFELEAKRLQVYTSDGQHKLAAYLPGYPLAMALNDTGDYVAVGLGDGTIIILPLPLIPNYHYV